MEEEKAITITENNAVEEKETNLPTTTSIDDVKKEVEETALLAMQSPTPENMSLFNQALIKSRIYRSTKYNDTLNELAEITNDRLKRRPDEISTKEMIDLQKSTSDSLNIEQKNMLETNANPTITLNQQTNTVNVNITDGMSRESKERVKDFIQNYLKQLNKQQDTPSQESEVVDAEVISND